MGERILFLELCNELEKIANTAKRLEIQCILASFLRRVISEDPESLSPVLFLCNASIYPDYFNTELGVGEYIIQATISEVTGLSIKTIKQKLFKSGDLSIIAMENRVRQLFIARKQLTVVGVFEQLRRIAKETGKSSTNAKKNIMISLINLCSPLETKYIIRLFECKLKIGLALQTILISLGQAFGASHPETVKDAYDKQSDFEYLSRMLLAHGVDHVADTCSVVPGVPLRPMLAQPSKNLTKAFSKFESGAFLSEFKYDGERVQIHHFDGKIKIFSRNTEDLTVKFPDIARLDLCGRSFIIDGEAVAYGDGKMLPFQTLSTRKRKNIGSIEVKVCVFCFDILYFDGEELLNHPLSKRREILKSNFVEIEDRFHFASGAECGSIEDIDAHFKCSLQSSCEGLMLKSLSSIYKPSHRSNSWAKLKKDYLDSLGDSLDLVVIGAFYGKGKRTGSFGGFLLGVYNDEIDKFEACCKIGTGFSDQNLEAFYNSLSPLITAGTSRIVYNGRGVKPDVWIEPMYVWEVKAASLTASPIYSAGSLDKGISLRFPRFIKERSDKKPQDATTSKQIIRMYNESKNDEEEAGD